MRIRDLLLAALLLFTACAGLPRVTTPEERATLLTTLTTIETGLAVMHSTGKLPTEHYGVALGQVADLRAAVAASETSPVSVADIVNRATALAAAWAITLSK